MKSTEALPNRSLGKQTLFRTQQFLIFLLPISAVLGPFYKLGPISPFVTLSICFIVVGTISVIESKNSVNQTPGIAILAGVWFISILYHELFSYGELNEALKSSIVGICLLAGVSVVPKNLGNYTSFACGMLAAWIVSAYFSFAEIWFGYVASNNWNASNTSLTPSQIGLTSLFTNPNNYAVFLILTGVVLAPLVIHKTIRTLPFWVFVTIVLSAYFLWLTESRTGYLIVISLVFGALVTIPSKTINYLLWRNLSYFILVILSIFFLIFSYIKLLSDSQSTLFNVFLDTSTSARIQLIEAGIDIWSTSPLFGVGDFQNSIMNGGAPNYEGILIDPHNGMVELLAEFGVIVFLSFVIFLSRVYAIGVRSFKTNKKTWIESEVPERTIAASLIALILILPIIGTMHSTFIGAHTGWLYLAAIVLLERSIPAQQRPTENASLIYFEK